MTNKIKKISKVLIVVFIASQMLISKAFAFENIKLVAVAESKNTIVQNEGKKSVLTQDWYGQTFELATKTSKMKAIKLSEYNKALKEVKFNIENVGEYSVYFLDTKLKDYSSAMALSFMDNSAVVFASTNYMSKQAIHRLAIHELGHQVDFQLMNESKWEEYKKIRGIENESKYNNNSTVYENRPQEIFAEDFRIILGGELAAKTSHMNSSLENANKNTELVKFFKDLVK